MKKGMKYDSTIDAGYIAFQNIKAGEVFRTQEVGDEILLDFDAQGLLIGLELLSLKALQDLFKEIYE